MTTAHHSAALQRPCPACGGGDFRRIFAKRGRDFLRCRECRLERQHPLPTPDEIVAYYEGHYASGRLKPMLAESEMIGQRMRQRFAEVAVDLGTAGRWLDVGCSDGAFVAEARRQGVDAAGIELASPAVEAARQRGLPVSQGRIEDLACDAPFDAVTAFDVLEHVPNPLEFLNHCRRLLRADGRLAVSVPNLASWARRLMGKRWYFYIPDGHLHYFHPATLRKLLAAAGFETLRLQPITKAVTLSYSLSQLQVLNPVLGKLCGGVHAICPSSLAARPWPLPLGEMLAVARRLPD